MQQLSTTVSSGNVRGLSRSQSDIQESLRIVPDITHDSFVFDSFAFLVKDMDEYMTSPSTLYQEETCIGTSTLSCFEYDNKILGGLLVSIPITDDMKESDIQSLYESYRHKFGDSLVQTVDTYPTETFQSDTQLTATDIGLSEMDISMINSTADSNMQNDIPVHSFGFTKSGTLNILYLVSEESSIQLERFSSLVRQLDTMLVFENPQLCQSVDGVVFTPCERVLSSTKLQSYLESEYAVSESIQFNLGNLDKPELYLDSVLGFRYTPQLGGERSVSVRGSRNASTVERYVRQATRGLRDVDTSGLVSIKSGKIGERGDTGESVFIGQSYVDWACDCDSQVCPTVITITSQDTLEQEDIEEIDSILQDVDGREPFDVSVNGVEVELSTQA